MNREDFFSYDENFYNSASAGVEASASAEERKQDQYLSFWCPVRRQKCVPSVSVRLETAAISIPQEEHAESVRRSADCAQLLAAFGSKGVEAWFANDASTANVILVVNPSICTVSEGYEIQSNHKLNTVTVVAADERGMLYALMTLTQLVRSYGTEGAAEHVSRHASRSISSYEDIGVEQPVLFLPAVAISDSPAIRERAVLWSMQEHLGCIPMGMSREEEGVLMAEQVALLANSRVNQLLFTIDFNSDDCHTEDILAEEKRLRHIERVLLPAFLNICRAYCINVQPVLHIRSIKQM